MNQKNSKSAMARWAAIFLCCALASLAAAQTSRPGGYSGGAARSPGIGGGSAASSASASGNHDYGNSTTLGPVSVSADAETRRIIYIADAATAAHVSEVISNLDRPKPQVLIKVVFLEVTYNNGLDVGIEGGITKNINASTTFNGSNLFGLVQQGIMPTSGATTVPGAGLYSVVGNDFSATLRAISEKGKVEVLSRPSILARNNQQATIVVGQEVPLITGVSYDTFGNEHSSISYQNVGIILQVTPFITSDGLVEMILAPQISQVAAQSTQISSGTNGSFSTPYIDIRSANTVVVTPDGQTVIIGGLIQDSKSTTDSKIPILGDIPLLGNLFKHKIRADSKTELLIFLTPYVVKTPTDLAVLSARERNSMEMAPKAFKEKELNQYLDALPQKPLPTKVSHGAGAPETH